MSDCHRLFCIQNQQDQKLQLCPKAYRREQPLNVLSYLRRIIGDFKSIYVGLKAGPNGDNRERSGDKEKNERGAKKLKR